MQNCTGEHCVTCSDEALRVRILQIDEARGIALVKMNGLSEEVDITLVGPVTPGDVLLIHGGVAIGVDDVAGQTFPRM